MGLNGLDANVGVPSLDGEAFDWSALGACCGAGSAVAEEYQSTRGPEGWQTRGIIPTPPHGLIGILEEQVPVFSTPDLGKTIYSTPVSYAAGDERPSRSLTDDLYLQNPEGDLEWLSQGPFGTGDTELSSFFDAATPDASVVAFSSAETLTENAQGIIDSTFPGAYLYVREPGTGRTELIDVDDSGKPIGQYGASLGSASYFSGQLPVNYYGISTHTLSNDGKKVFFETPPPGNVDANGAPPHLYMRDRATDTTTALDDVESSASASFQGASEDGSLVYFTSDEGLGGAAATNQLYVFDTTPGAIGSATAMTAMPVSSGEFQGVSAISNDGSRVYFFDKSVLATNTGYGGHEAQEGQSNLYVYEVASGRTVYVASFEVSDVSRCAKTCNNEAGGLIAASDLSRPFYPTPDGGVAVFSATSDLTGQSARSETTLTAPTVEGQSTISVASTAGFQAGHVVEIGTGSATEVAEVTKVESATELALEKLESFGEPPQLALHEAGERVMQPTVQVYRYDAEDGSLACLSCSPTETGSAYTGIPAGGSYNPPFAGTPMTADGSTVFFESTDALVPGVAQPASEGAEIHNLYEWEHGKLSLIAGGLGTNVVLDGTTPSGRDVFFTTRAQLTSVQNGGGWVVYDARAGGGFSEPPPPPPCADEACRAPYGGTPSFPSPASEGVVAPNLLRPTSHLSLAPISSGARRTLARHGTITLLVSASRAGVLHGEIGMVMGRRRVVVASRSAAVAADSVAKLQMRLSRRALLELRRHGHVRLRVDVSSSAGGTQAVELTIVSAKASRHV